MLAKTHPAEDALQSGLSDRTRGDPPWPEVVRLVSRQMIAIVGRTSDVDDLVQAALERIVRADGRFEGRAELSSYTYRVCARVAMNHWRWWRRWFRKFDLSGEDTPDIAGDSADLSDAAVLRQRARRLHAALEKMDTTRRIVVTLVDLEGLAVAHVAEILECPEPTVRSRLRRGRIELAALLTTDPLFAGDLETRTS